VYLAGLGPVKDGTPMNLYCIRGGSGGRTVARRGSFLTLDAAGLRAAEAPLETFAGPGGIIAGRPVLGPGLADGAALAGVAGLAATAVVGRSAFSGFLAASLVDPLGGFLAMTAADFEAGLLDFVERGSLRDGFFFSARLGRAGMGRVNSL
jgi:hypothetical protein